MAQSITSRDNETIKYACKLGQSKAFRQSEQRFLAEGLKLCLTLCETLAPLDVFYTSEIRAAHPEVETLGGAHYEIAPHVAEKLAQTQATQGIFCVFAMPAYGVDALVSGTRWVCMENVQDPANVGALLRSAAAFGFDGAVLSAGCADVFGTKALRASMGAVAKLALLCEADLPAVCAEMRRQGITVIAAALQNSQPLEAVQAPSGGVAVLVGNEGNGLTQSAIDAADFAVRIPMSDKVESLNAAVAGSVLLWHFRGGL